MNVIHTKLFIEIISIGIGILAIILTADKAIEVFLRFVQWVKSNM